MPRLTPAVVLIALLLASCATTSGSLFHEVQTSSSAGAASVAVSPSPTSSQTAGLTVTSSPSGAQVYLNDQYIGDTPVTYSSFQSGTYRLRVSKVGYYDNERWVTLDPTAATEVDVDLKERTGYILLSGVPENADVSIDGETANVGVNEVPTGPHTVRIDAFEYEDWTSQVTVAEGQTSEVQPQLVKAAFRIGNLDATRPVLSPLNPGALGETNLQFSVSTRGTGSLVITASNGDTVFTRTFPSFDKRAQSVEWNGRDADGNVLSDGAYLVTVTGNGSEPGHEEHSSATTSVRVKRGALISYRSLWSGASGLMYVATPEILPAGSFEVSSLALAHIEQSGAIAPIQLGLRVSPAENVELDLQASAIAQSTANLPYSAGLAAKVRLLRPEGVDGISAAAVLRGTYLSGTTSDTMTNFIGLAASLPVEYRLGPFGMVVAPEVIAAPYAATYSSTIPSLSLTAWGYGRAGLFLDFGSITTGVSASVRTAPFADGLALDRIPLDGGWELHWLIPGSQVVVSTAVAGEYSPTDGYYLMAGAGVGIID